MAKIIESELIRLGEVLNWYNNILDSIQLMLFSGEEVKIDDLLNLDMDSLIEQIKSYITKLDYDMDKYNQFRLQISFDSLIHITKIDNKESIVEKFTRLLERAEHYRNIISIKALMSKIKGGINDTDSIMLANACLDLLLKGAITIFDLPIEIQNVIREMLQNELAIEGSLAELLEIVKIRESKKLVERKRKMSLDN